MIKPVSFRRNDALQYFKGHLIAGIGAFSQACVNHQALNQPLEVLLVQGSAQEGFFARVGTAVHEVIEGKLSEGQISFTLESFESTRPGDPLTYLPTDSACYQDTVCGELRQFILNFIQKHHIRGGLLHIQGIAKNIHTYGHTDPQSLTSKTKTFDHPKGSVRIEGWGNVSHIEDDGPFVHLHGTYETRQQRKGGHFIMDEATPFFIEQATFLLYPVPKLVRAIQTETFPTWRV